MQLTPFTFCYNVLVFLASIFWRFSFSFSTYFVFHFEEMSKLFRMISDIVIWLFELISLFVSTYQWLFTFHSHFWLNYICMCIFWLPNMIWALLSFLFLWKYRVPFRLAWTKFAPNQETWNQFAEICHFQFVHVHYTYRKITK